MNGSTLLNTNIICNTIENVFRFQFRKSDNNDIF